MEIEDILYCYTMTHDTGFAPNPYHGVLTLATCKPLIRKYAKEGYWISGWTGNAVHNKQGKIDKNGAGRLIYLAKVSEKFVLKNTGKSIQKNGLWKLTIKANIEKQVVDVPPMSMITTIVLIVVITYIDLTKMTRLDLRNLRIAITERNKKSMI